MMSLFSCPNRSSKQRRLAGLSAALAALSGSVPLLFASSHGHAHPHANPMYTLIGMGCGVGVGLVICLLKRRRDRMNPYLNGQPRV